MSDSGGLLGRIKGKRPGPDLAVDALTGLPDRSNLLPWAGEALERSSASSTRCAVAFVSVGELRDVNDTHGPATGDALLRAVAERLGTIDLPDTRVLRYQGSEFAVLLEGLPGPDAADTAGAFLVELMAAPFATPSGDLTVPAHVGVAVSSDVYDVVADFTRDAHEALVTAREAGPNAHHVHDESKRMLHSTRIDEARLQAALADDEFVLHYQPIVRTDSSELVGVEALIRWEMPGATNVGILHPHDFMPLLERTGLAPAVGAWVVRTACHQLRAWQLAYGDERELFVTVNVGAHQLAAAGFADEVRAAVEAAAPIEPWQLCLDITEEALRYNRNASWAALRDLKRLGVQIGLDDFGTGVSSLLYLRELALDQLRIDRIFVGGVEHNAEDRAIIKHLAALADDLELTTIAEGVERPEQVDHLRRLGVELAQGYHFGRPMPAAGIESLLRSDEAGAPTRWDASEVYSFETS